VFAAARFGQRDSERRVSERSVPPEVVSVGRPIWRTIQWLFVPLLVMPLYFYGLGDTYLWQDEAHTALLGRHTVRYGLPMVGEGHESASALSGDDAGAGGVFLHIPPLQAYACAASFVIFGESSWSARLPFALAGWLCVLLLPWACGSGVPPGAKLWAQLVLGLHVPFLLHVRQCRYYGLAALLAVLALGAGLRIFEGGTRSGRSPGLVILLTLSLVGLGLTFEFPWAAAMGTLALALLTVLLQRGLSQLKAYRGFVAALVISFLVELAWVTLASTAPSRQRAPGSNFNPDFPDVPWYYFGFLNGYGVPVFWSLALAAVWLTLGGFRRLLARSRGAQGRTAATIGLTWAGYYGLFVLLSCVACTFTRNAFPRYIVPALPGAVLATVLLLHRVATSLPAGMLRVLLIAVLVLVTASGQWSFRVNRRAPLWPWEGWIESRTGVPWSRRNEVNLVSYLRELTHPPRGPVAAVVEYLSGHARPGDSIVAEYSEKPLKFHTRLKVYGGETGEYPPEPPEWIWIRPFRRLWREVKETREWIQSHTDPEEYEEIILPGVVDSQWENRPHPKWHVFEDKYRILYPHSRPYTILLRKRGRAVR